MILQVRDDVVTVHINGELMKLGTELSARSGAACLQAEGANVQYRKV